MVDIFYIWTQRDWNYDMIMLLRMEKVLNSFVQLLLFRHRMQLHSKTCLCVLSLCSHVKDLLNKYYTAHRKKKIPVLIFKERAISNKIFLMWSANK